MSQWTVDWKFDWKGDARWVFLILAAAVLLFLWGTEKQFLRNSDMTRTDQSAYMAYARMSRTVEFGHVPERNHMPLYPWVMSHFFKEGMKDQEYFELGKRINVVIALVTLLAVYIALLWGKHRMDATVGVAVLALSMVTYKAPCFQPEVLFFALSFFMFMAQLHLIWKPGWRMAIVAGVLSGLAHLCKGSVPPLIALTLVCLCGRAAVGLLRRRATTPGPADSAASWAKPLAAAFVFVVALLITMSPYLRANRQMYGRWLSENNLSYFWCDSWKQCQALLENAGGEKGLYAKPSAELPGPRAYFRTHSLQDAASRIFRGLKWQYQEHVRCGRGYARFILIYGLCLGMIGWQQRSHVRAWLRRSDAFWAAVFCAGFFLGYTLLCAWFSQIDNSVRYALIMLYPAIYLCVMALNHLRNADVSWSLLGARMKASAVSAMVLLFLVEFVIFDFIYRVQLMDGTT